MIDLTRFNPAEIDKAFDDTLNFFKTIPTIDIDRMSLQLEYSRKIIDLYAIEGAKNVVLQAPTGVGKSIIAFIVTRVIYELDRDYLGVSTASAYVLTADKLLQQQYERDITHFGLKETHVMLKGQANYSCHENGKNFTDRLCIDDTLTNVSSGKTSFKCAAKCEYIQKRLSAGHSEVAVFNYAYWLAQMHRVFSVNPQALFRPRTLTVFDECHVIENTVQDMFMTELNINQFIRRTITAFSVISTRTKQKSTITVESFRPLVEELIQLRKHQDDQGTNTKILESVTSKLNSLRSEYFGYINVLMEMLSTDADLMGRNFTMSSVDKVDRDMLKYGSVMVQLCDSFAEQCEIIFMSGTETGVYQFTELDSKFNKSFIEFGMETMYTLTVQCTNVSKLTKTSMHQYTQYGLYMSATVDVKTWPNHVGIENYSTIEIPEQFDYTRSPIFTVTPTISMNFREKKTNMPKMVERIIKIMNEHPNERGLVHTGTFEMSRALQATKDKRLIFYNNASEKDAALKVLKTTPNGVLIGPSLLAGVDLSNDLCRFSIFMKVPYMSLADKLIKQKSIIYDTWYGDCAMTQFLQGIGRGVRNPNDWCVTYLLDGSFTSFFQRVGTPEFIKHRMFDTHIDSLGTVINHEEEFEDMLANL